MTRTRFGAAVFGLALAAASAIVSQPAWAAGNPMKLVGALNPWKDGQFSNVAADASRHVGYLGSFDDQGVAVIDTRDPAFPSLTDVLSTHIAGTGTSDSADLDLVGGYLAVSHQSWSGDGFVGISVYDTLSDPYHPFLVRHIPLPGGIHSVQLDPEVGSGRPFAYANAIESTGFTYVVDILTGALLSKYAPAEGVGCIPSDEDCRLFLGAHEGFLQRSPAGRMLDYVSFWDAGLRIVDVTDPAHPVEVGAFPYPGPLGDLCCAHYAAPTPSGNWVYLEDEIGVGGTGGVHVLRAQGCDGVQVCTVTQVGLWHINGHPVQAAAIDGVGSGAFHGVIQRFFTYDAHNLDIKGENALLVANYTMGIRLIDTTDKAAPREVSFYLPNANKNLACIQNCFFQGRETWGAYFGSDGRIYASDFWLGFFVVQPPPV